MLRSHGEHAEGARLVFQAQDAVCYPFHVTRQPHSDVPDVSENDTSISWTQDWNDKKKKKQQSGGVCEHIFRVF